MVSSLKDALDEPAFKLYFLPLDGAIRLDVQTKIQGVVNAFAGLIAGGIILILSSIEVFNLLYISLSAVPLLIIWYVVTKYMHKGYKETLQDTLQKNKLQTDKDLINEYSVSKLLKAQVNSKIESNKLMGLKLMEKLEPDEFDLLKKELRSENPKVLAYLADPSAKVDASSQQITKKLAQKAIKENQTQDVLPITFERLSELARSLKVEERLYAAKIFQQYADGKNIFLLIDLLKDANQSVRLEAINTARLLKRHETWNTLIDMLDSQAYGFAASAALISAGEPALHHMESAFHKSGQSDRIMLAIVRIMGKIGGEEAEKLLLKKIDYPDKRIVYQMLEGFGYTDFNAKGNHVQIIQLLIDQEIGKTVWNLAAISETPKEKNFEWLRQAIKEEIRYNYDQVFMLLSLLYDAESVNLVKENILSESAEGVAYGMELLDMFLDPELKPKLFPLIDDISINEKINRLSFYYPRDKFEPLGLLNNMLNRDFNQLSRWVKACALYCLAFEKDFHTNYAVLSHIFNKDRLLKEVATWLVYHRDPEKFEQVIDRVNEEERDQLVETVANNSMTDGLSDGYYLLVEIVMFLKGIEVFQNISGIQLCELADNTQVIQLKEGEHIQIDNQENNAIYVVAEGKLQLTGIEEKTLKERDFIGELFQAEKQAFHSKLYAQEQSTVFKMNINNFYTQMSKSRGFTNEFFTAITKSLA